MERRIDSISQATNWTHKHHFIVRKTKKTYLTEEKEQTGVFCELKTCFYFKYLLAKNMRKNTGKKHNKNQVNSPLDQENVLSISEFMSIHRYCF